MGSLSEEVRTEVLCGHICELEGENAKLRELMSDMWNDAVTRMDFVDRHEFIGKFLDRLRDLEVEV